MMVYAQILNKVVINTIVLDDETLLPQFTKGFEYCERVDHLVPQPGIGAYFHNGRFTKVIIDDVFEIIPDDVPRGVETSFDPFQFSEESYGWQVRMENGVLRIGCHHYDYFWLRYALWKILTQGADKAGPLLKTNDGVSYGNIFNIKQADINNLYSTLCLLK